MTLANQLAGAMGLASWRAHLTMADYEKACLAGKTFTGGKKSPPKAKAVSAIDLNEVGLTDALLATLWGSGPFKSAAATTGPAEKHYFGADIAILDLATKRILLYQAKIGHLISSKDLKLKSKVTSGQVTLLQKSSVTVDGIRYAVTGRLAIYQTGYRPHMHRAAGIPWIHGLLWSWAAKPSKALKYYGEVLSSYSYSPCGVMAAKVPAGVSEIKTITGADTWPWEFDAYQWLHGAKSNLDQPELEREPAHESKAPDWRDDDDQPISRLEPGEPEFALRLQDALGMSSERQLHVLSI